MKHHNGNGSVFFPGSQWLVGTLFCHASAHGVKLLGTCSSQKNFFQAFSDGLVCGWTAQFYYQMSPHKVDMSECLSQSQSPNLIVVLEGKTKTNNNVIPVHYETFGMCTTKTDIKSWHLTQPSIFTVQYLFYTHFQNENREKYTDRPFEDKLLVTAQSTVQQTMTLMMPPSEDSYSGRYF